MTRVLLVSICKEKLHELEFVKPVADVLKEGDVHFEVCHYSDLCTVDEVKRFDQLMQTDSPSIGEVLSDRPSGFFEQEEVLSYINSFSHVIICGTSLQDNDFGANLELFSWLSEAKIPVFGICGGFQIIGMLFGGKMMPGEEIGYYNENVSAPQAYPRKQALQGGKEFGSDFFGLEGKQEVFHLHNNYVEFSDNFDAFAKSGEGIVQAVKHKEKNISGVLFHPEVRQKEMILEFVNGKS